MMEMKKKHHIKVKKMNNIKIQYLYIINSIKKIKKKKILLVEKEEKKVMKQVILIIKQNLQKYQDVLCKEGNKVIIKIKNLIQIEK